MKVVILAGGLGTRLAEETDLKPKPMVEIGGRPILWHILKHYAYYGFNEFLIGLGYKGDVIKHFFYDYCNLNGDMTVHTSRGAIDRHRREGDDWTAHLIDTGQDTATGGRVKRLEPWLKDGTFMLTYGDGVSNIDLRNLLKFHQSHGRIATISAVHPTSRFGGIEFDGDLVAKFSEKPQIEEEWINGGFMVLEPGIFQYLDNEQSNLERDGLERLAAERQLAALRHDGFWQCMDNLREKRLLEKLWQDGEAPWKVWA